MRSGDVDFNTGDLQQSYQAYRNLLSNLSVDLTQNLQREEKEFLVKACEYIL